MWVNHCLFDILLRIVYRILFQYYSKGRTQNRCLESPALSYSKSFILSACFDSYFVISSGYSVLHYALAVSIVDPRLAIGHSGMSFNFDSSYAATTVAA